MMTEKTVSFENEAAEYVSVQERSAKWAISGEFGRRTGPIPHTLANAKISHIFVYGHHQAHPESHTFVYENCLPYCNENIRVAVAEIENDNRVSYHFWQCDCFSIPICLSSIDCRCRLWRCQQKGDERNCLCRRTNVDTASSYRPSAYHHSHIARCVCYYKNDATVCCRCWMTKQKKKSPSILRSSIFWLNGRTWWRSPSYIPVIQFTLTNCWGVNRSIELRIRGAFTRQRFRSCSVLLYLNPIQSHLIGYQYHQADQQFALQP